MVCTLHLNKELLKKKIFFLKKWQNKPRVYLSYSSYFSKHTTMLLPKDFYHTNIYICFSKAILSKVLPNASTNMKPLDAFKFSNYTFLLKKNSFKRNKIIVYLPRRHFYS